MRLIRNINTDGDAFKLGAVTVEIQVDAIHDVIENLGKVEINHMEVPKMDIRGPKTASTVFSDTHSVLSEISESSSDTGESVEGDKEPCESIRSSKITNNSRGVLVPIQTSPVKGQNTMTQETPQTKRINATTTIKISVPTKYTKDKHVDISDPAISYKGMGQMKLSVGSTGSQPGRFFGVYGVTSLSDGKVVAMDNKNHRVQIFDSTLNVISVFGSHGKGVGELDCPYGVATTLCGDVVVADSHNNRIQIFSVDGTFKSYFGSEGSGNGQFKFPQGITVDSEGLIYVCDSHNSRVSVHEDNGKYIHCITGGNLKRWSAEGSDVCGC